MTKLIPPVDVARTELQAPVVQVTLLEDRAMVRRQGRISLPAGRHRLVVYGASPVLQDVSLQTEWLAGEGRVADVVARRAWRILVEDRPQEAADLEAQIEAAERTHDRLDAQRMAARQRRQRVTTMVRQATHEVPVDAAWGRVDPDTWNATFGALFGRIRDAAISEVENYHAQLDNLDALDNLVKRRRALDRMDTEFVGWLGVDVDMAAAGEAELAIEYVVPCAVWRPIHAVRWAGEDRVTVRSSAVLWQNTGEDWSDVALHFSTSRASLGHEPPMLTDDPLTAERKDDELRVEVRQVEVQQAMVEGAEADDETPAGAQPTPSDQVELPGVEDGGQRRHLVAPGRHRVPADGRPVRVPLSTFEAEARGELITVPEDKPVAVWRVVARHSGTEALLAGPVELIRDHGPVGWTDTRFVATGAPFELGFGPDEAVRVERTVQRKQLDRHRDEWPATQRTVRVFLSNLGPAPKRLKVIERIPVSEIDEVRVTLEGDFTTEGHAVDDDGFVTWTLELEGRGHREIRLRWVLASAPSLNWSFD